MRRVLRGETITVTQHRRPVARIVPLRSAGSEEAVRHLVEVGLVSWSGGKPAGSRQPPRVSGATIAGAVVEDRR